MDSRTYRTEISTDIQEYVRRDLPDKRRIILMYGVSVQAQKPVASQQMPESGSWGGTAGRTLTRRFAFGPC